LTIFFLLKLLAGAILFFIQAASLVVVFFFTKKNFRQWGLVLVCLCTKKQLNAWERKQRVSQASKRNARSGTSSIVSSAIAWSDESAAGLSIVSGPRERAL
jgi:hypothetical protein